MSKIMLIHHSGLIGGAGISMINTIKSLLKENEIIVYAPSEPSDMSDLLWQLQSDFEVKTVNYGRRIGAITHYSGGDKVCSFRFLYRLLLIFKQWAYWNREIAKVNPDIVIVNSKILCWMSRLSQVRKRKSICFIRETINGNPRKFVNRIISKFLESFSGVIFISDYDRKRENLNRTRTKVVHNYIDENQFDVSVETLKTCEAFDLKSDSFHVLFVGGVSEMKGFDLVVKAVLSSGSDVELIVAGSSFEDVRKLRDTKIIQYADEMQKYIKANDKFNQIHIVGKQKDMSKCYAACDVLVFPMRSPHQARPVFEAGYFSKPVIITDFENIKEFVRNGENGFTVPVNEDRVLAEKILYLKENPHIAKQMGEKNRKNTEDLHNKDINCMKIVEFVKEFS